MKNLKYCIFWIVIIYSIELAISYLISLVWVESLNSVVSNAMVMSFGFLVGVLFCNYKSR